MDNDNLFNVAFRKFGGLNYSANNNVTHSTYSNATNMLVSNQVGAKNTNILIQSNVDMSNSSFFNIDTAYFDATTVTSQNGALTFNNTSGSTGLNFNIASGTTYRFNTTDGSSIAMHEQTISTASGDLSFTAPSINTVFIDPDLTVPKITTRPGTDLFITTGSPDGHIRDDRIIDISGNVVETGDTLFIGAVGITGEFGVTGPSAFNGTVGVTGEFGVTGPSAFNGTVGVTGLFGVTGTSSFNNFVGITGFLGVTGTTNIQDHVGITGLIGVTGRANINGHVVVAGAFGVTGQSAFDGNVGIIGANGVTGSAIFNGPVGITGPIGVTGHSNFNGTVGITGNMNARGTSVFNGNVEVFGPVVVTGAATFDGVANVYGPFGTTGIAVLDGQVDIYGPFGITGSSTFNGSVGVTGVVGVTGTSVFNGSVGIDGVFGVTGVSTFVSDVGIIGSLGVTAPSNFNGSVGVTGVVGVTGPSIFNGSVGIDGAFGITGSSTFNGSVGITEAFGLTGPSIFNGTVGITGAFGITGPTILNGNANFIGDIQITGDTPILFNNGFSIEGKIGITGPSMLNGSVGVTGEFGVTGPSTLNGDVTINGPVTIDGPSTFSQDLEITTNGSFISMDSHTFEKDMTFNVVPTSTNFTELSDNILAVKYYVNTKNIPGSTLLYNNNIWTGTNQFNKMSIRSAFGVTGTSAFNGQVGVIGPVGVTGASLFNGPVGVKGAFGVTSASILNGSVGIRGAVGVTGTSAFNGPVGVTGAFGVTGTSILNGPVGVTGEFGVTGTSTLNGQVGVKGAFGVTGTSIFNGAVGVTGVFGVTGESNFYGPVEIISGELNVHGKSTISILFMQPELNVTGNTTLDGNVVFNDLLDVTGSSVFNGSVGIRGAVGVTGTSTFNGSVGISGAFGVTGRTTFNGPVGIVGAVGVTGPSTFNGPVGISGAFGVTGASTFNGSVGIRGAFGVTGVSILNGPVGISGAFGVTGTSILNGSVGISGAFGLTGTSTLNGQVGVRGLFGVTGSSTFIASDVTVNNPAKHALGVTGVSEFNGDTRINGGLIVTGKTVFTGQLGIDGLRVTGNSEINGQTRIINGGLTVAGASIFKRSLGIKDLFGVTGPSTFNGSVGVSGAFGVTGGTTFNGSVGIIGAVGITGPSTFNGSVGVSGTFGVTGGASFNGSVNIIGAVGVTGPSTFNGSVGITGLFGVTGASIFNGSVNIIGAVGITGPSIFNGSVGITGLFGVTGASTFNGSVGIIGAVGVTGPSIFNGNVGITGLFGVTGTSIFNGPVGIIGAVGITGPSIFNGSVGIVGAFGLTGPSAFNGPVGIIGAVGVTGPSTFNGNVGITGFFGVTGTSRFNGPIGIVGAVGVTGPSTFNGSVGITGLFGVTGASIFNGPVGIIGAVGVTGPSTFNSSVGVTGFLGVTGASIFNGSVLATDLFGVTDTSTFNGSISINGATNYLQFPDGTQQTSANNVAEQHINQDVYGQTRKKNSIAYNTTTSITSRNVVATIDNFVPRQEAYSFGNNIPNMWVAGGTAGANTLAYSYDGMNWIGLGTSIFSTGCFGVKWNGTIWVAGGGGINTLAYSYDGINWVGLGNLNSNVNFYGIEWNGTMWVAGGDNTSGNMAYSYDGIKWYSVTTPFGLSTVGCVAWNGLMWVAGSNSQTNTMAYSYDGINWVGLGNSIAGTETSPFTGECRDVKWNGQMWVAVGNGTSRSSAYSYNGINWSYGNHIFNNGGISVEWNGKMWVAGGDGDVDTMAYSYDGIAWSGLGNTILEIAYNIKWNGTMWIACGDGDIHTIAYSYDGIRWTKILTSNSLFNVGRCIAFNSARPNTITFPSNNILIGSQSLMKVSNPNALPPSTMVDASQNLTSFLSTCNCVNWNGSMWVAVGARATNTKYTIAASADGIIWTGIDASNNLFSDGNAVAWNGTMWVAGGTTSKSYPIAYSYDSYTWIGVNNNIFSTVSAIAYNDNDKMWVAVGGGSNSIAYSDDGIEWSGLGNTIILIGQAVAWNGQMWVAGGVGVGLTHTLAYSYDGINWTGLGNTVFSYICYTLDWNGQMWVASGSDFSSSIAILAYSSDGINWNKDWTLLTNDLISGTSIATNNNEIIVAGATASDIALFSNNSDSHTISGATFNGIDYNSTLNKWVAVGNNTVATSTDGANWATTNITAAGLTTGNCVASDLNGNAYRWIAGGVKSAGVGGFITSSDATTWTEMECIGTTFATRTPLTTVKSIACYYNAPYPSNYNSPQAKWVALCDGSANIASAVNTYKWIPNNNTDFDNITGFACDTVRCMIVGNKSNTAVINTASGIWNNNYTNAITFTNVGMTGCNAVAANIFTGNYNLGGTIGTTKYVVVGTGRGTYDASYSGIAPIYEFDISYNYMYGANPVVTSGITFGYSTYLTTGSAGADNGYTQGNSVACDASATAYGEAKWVVAGRALVFARIYVGRFASKWTARSAGVSPFIPSNIAYQTDAAKYVMVSDDGLVGIRYSTNLTSWTNCTFISTNGSKSMNCVASYSGIPLVPVAYANLKFLAGGRDRLVHSSDGITWYNTHDLTAGDNIISVACYSNVVAGDVFCSYILENGLIYYILTNNGNKYAANTITGSKQIAVNSLGNWLVVGGNRISYSANGKTYTNTSPTNLSQYNAVSSVEIPQSSIKWVVVGNNTSNVTICYTNVINGSSGWTSVANSNVFFTDGTAVTCNTNMWVASGTKNAGGYLHFAFSYDGINWFSLGNFSNTFTSCYSIKYIPDTSQIIAVGMPASGTSTNYTVGDMSTNAIAWSRSFSDILFSHSSVACNSYAATNAVKWVCVGESSLAVGGICTSTDGIVWQALAVSSTDIAKTTLLKSVVYSQVNTRWVAVGSCATTSSTNNFSIIYSTDGTNWIGVTNSSYISTNFKSVTFTNYMFVAVTSETAGNSSRYAYSYNGIYWFAASVNNNINASFIGSGVAQEPGVVGISTNNTNNIYTGSYAEGNASWAYFLKDANAYNCVACNNSIPISDTASVKWVVVGNNSLYCTSTNGITWISKNFSNIINGYGVACNNTNVWVVVGSGTNTIIYSNDINNNAWTAVTNNTTIFNGSYGKAIAWSGTYFVATGANGSIALSNNGVTWYAYYNIPSSIKSIKWTGFYWTAAGIKNSIGCLIYSVDGKYWKETAQSGTFAYPNALNTIGWTSNVSNVNIKHPIVAVGTGTKTAIAYSIDGYKWINVGANIFDIGYAVAWNGTMWVAVGEGPYSIAYSYDGLKWTGISDTGIFSNGKCIAWNGKRWLAGSISGIIAYSSNGINWTTISQSFLTRCNAIAWNGTMWCAGGTTTNNTNPIITSANGLSWTQSTNNFTTCRDIKSNGQMWVAVGSATTSANAIQYSYNGTNWYSATGVTSTTNINVVAWNGKRWLAGTTEKILSSGDGIIWVTKGDPQFATFTALAWTGDKWVVGGNNSVIINNIAFKTSFNGITWNEVSQPVLSAINGIAGNPRIGATVLDSQLTLSSGGAGLDNTLDIVSDAYYQSGYTNMETIVYSANL